MGGVLVELGPLDELLGLEMSPEEFWPAWLSSPSVRRFERGECSTEEFGRGLVDELGLPIPAPEVVDRFLHFPRGLFPGAADLVTSLVDGVVSAVLTNTNPLHWERQVDAAVIRKLFDRQFLSFELGLVKPDTAIFGRVARELALDPGEILFLDDNQLNVDGALEVGLDAHQVRGVEEARLLLGGLRLLR
jgi:putative hydrolase of the HAD superfamily